MNNKYYTPKIEEFHVGFECEFAYDRVNYEQQIYDGSQVLKSKYYYDDNAYELDAVEDDLQYFRVKHLDKEDIESLGFIGQNANSVYFKKGKYRLVHWMTSNEIGRDISIFESYDGETQEECLIRKCVVKNKSELKTLLKQLNINET